MTSLLFVALAVLLLFAGVIGSVIPSVPGVILSISGVFVYWWASGYAEPSAAVVGVVTVLGALVVVAGFFQDVIAARLGGASGWSAAAAGVVGLVCFFALGPLGAIVGSAVAVFVLEYRRQRDATAGARAATAVVLATIGSAVVELLVTLTILVVVVVVIVL